LPPARWKEREMARKWERVRERERERERERGRERETEGGKREEAREREGGREREICARERGRRGTHARVTHVSAQTQQPGAWKPGSAHSATHLRGSSGAPPLHEEVCVSLF